MRFPTTEASGEYKFTCIDRGIGMSDEFQKKMFEPFTQESSETLYNHSGIGLGLSVVKKTDRQNGRPHKRYKQKEFRNEI